MTSSDQSLLAGQPSQRPENLDGVHRAVAVAVVSVVTLALTYVIFVRTTAGQHFDQAATQHLAASLETRDTVANLLQEVTVVSVLAVLGICVAIAALRRRGVLAVGAVVLVAGANVTTQALKHVVLSRPNLGYETVNSLPSGHLTVTASLALAALLVVPRTVRGITAMLGAVSIAVIGVGTVVTTWHRPSDVIGALAVTLAWGAAVLAALSWRGYHSTGVRPRSHTLALLVGLAVAAGFFVALGVRPDGYRYDLFVHLIVMCGLSLCGALVVGLYARMIDSRVD